MVAVFVLVTESDLGSLLPKKVCSTVDLVLIPASINFGIFRHIFMVYFTYINSNLFLYLLLIFKFVSCM